MAERNRTFLGPSRSWRRPLARQDRGVEALSRLTACRGGGIRMTHLKKFGLKTKVGVVLFIISAPTGHRYP